MKTALITGASGGIGAELARAFGRAGYAVAVHCHNNAPGADKLRDELRGFTTALCCRADVSDPGQVNAMFDYLHSQLGHIDVLVNNAGVAQQKLFTDITDGDWRRMMGVHLDGAFYCSRAALQTMLPRKSGCIINISSMWGQIGASCEVHYSAAKAGLIGMTRALAKELGPSGVRVNCIAAGAIDTPMNASLPEGALAAIAEETPLARLGTPGDIASAAVFLASEEASFITGQVLGINGGLVI